jgi:hypothetical protein
MTVDREPKDIESADTRLPAHKPLSIDSSIIDLGVFSKEGWKVVGRSGFQ